MLAYSVRRLLGILPTLFVIITVSFFLVRLAPGGPFDQEQSALLVPDTALGADQAGRYLLVVNGENVVEQRKVTTGQVNDGLRVIESGLKPDDRVVIGGLLRAIPGQKVDPQATKIGSGTAAAN